MAIKTEFIVERQGKSFVLYAGLLSLAHEQGLKAIHTYLVQVPSEENGQTAICTALVETERGTFGGIGDASPTNVSRAMLHCTIRLAETRAKARALRDAVNVGVAALEELGDADQGETQEYRPVAPLTTAPASAAPIHNALVSAGANAPTSAQLGAVEALGKSRGIAVDQVATKMYGATVARLDRRLVSGLIDALKRETARVS